MPAGNWADLPQWPTSMLERVRKQAPRVHCLMNTVVQKLVADGLSALGAIPSMTSSTEEVQDFARKADALVVNLGTLDKQRREAIGLAVDVAAAREIPWVLDPAHCDYSPPRARFAQDLLQRQPTALRANAAEYGLLTVPDRVVAVETGVVDHISFAGQTISVANGDPLMAKVTGTGCLSGAVIAAFLAVDDDRHAATAAAMLVLGVAAEKAALSASGPGSFEPALLDALAALDGGDILERAKVTG
ncbi:hydroxyethylthiazole kinase [Pseudaminobacter manganicus]|uniref:hydroxyethylthiazole kinase n=2 Tax=Manganibacter manganicus TaxID=1873176 RepID=A0A1V8RS99_9HYPH|nr:hydroxyethylthiazole kinase [Pseudaminobacter manganicus]